jgi:hypothetical protein
VGWTTWTAGWRWTHAPGPAFLSSLWSVNTNNVKTVKEHTFHKRSTNVPTANRNETKTSEFIFESSPSKEHISIGSGEQILDQIETIDSQQDKYGNDTKTFWLRFRNDIGTFVLSFLTLLVNTIRIPRHCYCSLRQCFCFYNYVAALYFLEISR